MGIILKAVSKLRGCVNQIVNKNPSGASEQDIIDQAKMLLTQDPNYKKGFAFGHVWNILKDVEKFTIVNPTPRSQHKGSNFSPSPTSSTASVEPSFDLIEDVGIKYTERPTGVKKAKTNLQYEKNMHHILEANKKMCDALNIGNEIALKKLEAQNERNWVGNETNRLAKITEENKILFTDLNTISDPEFHEYIQSEKKRIIRKRTKDSQGQGSQYEGSQYRASQYQPLQQQPSQHQPSQYQGSQEEEEEEEEDQDQDQDQEHEQEQERPHNYNQYFHYLDGSGNDFNNF